MRKGHASLDADEITLKDLFNQLFIWKNHLQSKWIIIVLAGLSGAALGFVYSRFNTPKYTAQCTFVLEESRSGGLSQYSGFTSLMGIDLSNTGSGIFQGDNLLELYKSRLMLKKTLLSKAFYKNKSCLLIDVYIDLNNLKEKWNKNKALTNISFNTQPFNRLQDSILKDIVDHIRIENLGVSKPDKKLNIFEVSIKAENEYFAKAFNETMVANVNDFYIKTKTKKESQNVKLLQQEVDSLKRSLTNNITGTATALDINPNPNPAKHVLKAPSQRRQFDSDANKAILTELLKNLELAKLTLRMETPLIQLIDSPSFPLEKTRFSGTKGIVFGFLAGSIITVLYLTFLLLKREILA